VFVAASNADTDEWVKAWKLVTVQGTDHVSHTSLLCLDRFRHNPLDLVESPVVAIDADESVEVACDVRGLCRCCVRRCRVYIDSLGPPVIHRPLFGHPSEGFVLSRLI